MAERGEVGEGGNREKIGFQPNQLVIRRLIDQRVLKWRNLETLLVGIRSTEVQVR